MRFDRARARPVSRDATFRPVSAAPDHLALAAAMTFAASVLAQGARAEESAGEAQFKKSCGVCHTAEKGGEHRQGPNLYGVFGGPSAHAPDFKYSPALKSADLKWDLPTLDRWIEDPQQVVKGAVMGYRQADPDKRALVIDYLATLRD